MSPMYPDAHDHRRPHRILLADADDTTRMLYRDCFQMAGSDVVDAADGRDAMVKALSIRPTVVVTELRLPIFDGLALCAVLRQDSMTRTVPIVVVTADSRQSEIDRAHDAGADLVLIKPVAPEALRQRIVDLLEQPELPSKSPRVRQPPASRRASLSKSHQRVATTTPPLAPPDLRCPSCDGTLSYQGSFLGGVSQRQPEQWDEYECSRGCGRFTYRQRTRKLRRDP